MNDTNLKPNKDNKRYRSGFTLVETLVAISILMLAVSGPLTLAQQSLRTSMMARDQVIASYLAQDAIEFIRSVRDNDPTSLASLLGGCNSSNVCSINTIDLNVIPSTITRCGDENDFSGCLLALDDSTGEYKPYISGSNKSHFYRYLEFKQISGSDEANVNVVVAWQNGAGLRKVNIGEYLFNWR